MQGDRQRYREREGEDTSLAEQEAGKTEVQNQERKPVIPVRKLYKVYPIGESKVFALNGVDLTIREGEFCSIVGTSGSGNPRC